MYILVTCWQLHGENVFLDMETIHLFVNCLEQGANMRDSHAASIKVDIDDGTSRFEQPLREEWI